MTTPPGVEVADLGSEGTAMVPAGLPLSTLAPMSSDDVLRQVRLIQEVMKKTMKEGEHFGVIPGTEKPCLLKSGAEKLSLTFRLRPKFRIERLDLTGEHREYVITCDLFNQAGGHEGQGIGSCSTMESKYRWRQAKRQCPKCGAEAIIKGKEEYGGGWLCWKKQDGCGAKFAETAPEIVSQMADRAENPDIADTFNTVLKMAKKRALVDATLTATAASDLFAQDLEDLPRAAKTQQRGAGAPHEVEDADVEDVEDKKRTYQQVAAEMEKAMDIYAALQRDFPSKQMEENIQTLCDSVGIEAMVQMSGEHSSQMVEALTRLYRVEWESLCEQVSNCEVEIHKTTELTKAARMKHLGSKKEQVSSWTAKADLAKVRAYLKHLSKEIDKQVAE